MLALIVVVFVCIVPNLLLGFRLSLICCLVVGCFGDVCFPGLPCGFGFIALHNCLLTRLGVASVCVDLLRLIVTAGVFVNLVVYLFCFGCCLWLRLICTIWGLNCYGLWVCVCLYWCLVCIGACDFGFCCLFY